MAKQLNDFSGFAQRVWAQPTIATKTPILLEMIDACQSSNEKKAGYRRSIEAMSCSRMDRFASDMMLRDTDKRIR